VGKWYGEIGKEKNDAKLLRATFEGIKAEWSVDEGRWGSWLCLWVPQADRREYGAIDITIIKL